MLNSLALEFILHIDEDLKSFLFEIWAEEDEQEDFCLVSCKSTALTCGMHAQMRVEHLPSSCIHADASASACPQTNNHESLIADSHPLRVASLTRTWSLA